MFNLKFSKFLEEHPDITMVSLGWSLLWRVWVLVYGIIIAIAVIAEALK